MILRGGPYTSPDSAERLAQANFRTVDECKAIAARNIAEFDKRFNGGS